MLNVTCNCVTFAECRDAECRYAECRDAECRYAECRYVECRYVECRGTHELSMLLKFLHCQFASANEA